MPAPTLQCLISTDPYSDTTPTFNLDVSARLRHAQTERGRGSEFQDFDPGTMTVLLANNDRALDPGIDIFPRMRIRLLETTGGVQKDVFYGYIDSVRQGWDPTGNNDQVVEIKVSDELKLLGLQKLPAMDPAGAATYADVIAKDSPAGYWKWGDVGGRRGRSLTSGGGPFFFGGTPSPDSGDPTGGNAPIGDWSGSFGISNVTPVLGDPVGSSEDGAGGCLTMISGQTLIHNDATAGDARGTGTFFAVEFWLRKSAGVAATFLSGPTSASFGGAIWTVALTALGAIVWTFRDSAGTNHNVNSVLSLSNNTWYHVACIYDGTQRIYINGTQNVAGAALGLTFASSLTTPYMSIAGTAAVTIDLDELAVHIFNSPIKGNLPRFLAHYNAGALRGVATQTSLARVSSILTAAGSNATLLSSGSAWRNMQPVFYHGQSAIEELRRCALAEAPDGAVFALRSGEIKILAANHRSSSPYNTVQATFGDQGGLELPLLNAPEPTYDDSRIVNDWNVTREGPGGVNQNAQDATSISSYGDIPGNLTGLPLLVNADAASIATALLAKTKDPIQRVETLTPNMNDLTTAKAVFALDLMDRVRVLRTLIGGGARFDQTLFVQKISHTFSPGLPAQTTLTVSPV